MTDEEPDQGPEPLEPGTIVLRQVHPAHDLGDRISAQAFNPSKTDNGLLSTHHGRIGPDEAFRRWTDERGHESIGSFGVSIEEIDAVEVTDVSGATSRLSADEDGHLLGVDDHVSVDFTDLATPGMRKQAARKLLSAAMDRGGALNS